MSVNSLFKPADELVSGWDFDDIANYHAGKFDDKVQEIAVKHDLTVEQVRQEIDRCLKDQLRS
jgi:hypothetical protein